MNSKRLIKNKDKRVLPNIIHNKNDEGMTDIALAN